MEFKAKEETKKIIKFIKDYYQDNNLGGAVIGISGGKDSAVVLALLVKALGKENVLGLALPCHSKETDLKDAKKVTDYYGVELKKVDLTDTFDVMTKEIMPKNDDCLENSNINLKPRLRMASLYYMAALMTAKKEKLYLVIGTSNKCENFVGYFTKGGDSVHDLAPIADLTVSEVIKIGEVLKVPKEVLYKTPSDGISLKTDEEKLGVTYNDIELYMSGELDDKETKKVIKKLHDGAKHKFNIPKYERK